MQGPTSIRFFSLALAAVGLMVLIGSNPHDLAAQPIKDDFTTKIVPFLNTHCNGCHNSEKNSGGISLDARGLPHR